MSPPLVVPSAERIDLPTMGMPGPVIRLVALATKCPTPDPGPRADAFATPGKHAHIGASQVAISGLKLLQAVTPPVFSCKSTQHT